MQKITGKLKLIELTDIIVYSIQLVLSIVLVLLLKKILPEKYVVLIVCVFAFVWLILVGLSVILTRKSYKAENADKKRTLKNVKLAFQIVSIVMSVFLAAGCALTNEGLSTINNITNVSYQTQVVSVVVKNDSEHKRIAGLDGETVGIVEKLDFENTEKALKEIETVENTLLEPVYYASAGELAEALLDESVDAIMFNEAYRGLLEDVNADFTTKTKIIYQYQIQEELEIDTPDVNISYEPFNVYISGIDTYGPVSSVSRSDVNMVVTVNPKTKKILMTSIPRDYYVELASFGALDKLTHAGIYGVEESMKTLENLFGTEIDYYARVNFTSLVTMVDALGGITVDNPQEFESYHTHDLYPQGKIEMDGETALEFVRERYGLEGGDNDRVKNQQRVLAAMIDKAISPAIIKNYSSILSAVSDSVMTNMSSEDIQKLIQMQLNDMSPWTIEQISVTGTGSMSTNCYSSPGYELYVMEPNYESVQAAADKINSVESEQ